jgi:hypothetical protein
MVRYIILGRYKRLLPFFTCVYITCIVTYKHRENPQYFALVH